MQTKHKVAGGAIAICISLVGAFEGLRLKTYKDAVGIPTVCYGETRGVKMGQTYTLQQCNEMFIPRLEEFQKAVERCVKVPMSDNRKAATISFAYNVGIGGMCSSSYVKRLNANDPKACDALLSWNKAGGRVLKGLTSRREMERQYCLK